MKKLADVRFDTQNWKSFSDALSSLAGVRRHQRPELSTLMRHLGRVGSSYGIPSEAIARSLDGNLTRLARTFGRRLAALQSSVDKDPDMRQLSDLYVRKKLGQEAKLYRSILSSWKAHSQQQKALRFADGTIADSTNTTTGHGRLSRKRQPPSSSVSKNRCRSQPDIDERRNSRLSEELLDEANSPIQERSGIGASSRNRKAKTPSICYGHQPSPPTKMQTRYASFNPTPGERGGGLPARMGEDGSSITETELSDEGAPPVSQQQNLKRQPSRGQF